MITEALWQHKTTYVQPPLLIDTPCLNLTRDTHQSSQNITLPAMASKDHNVEEQQADAAFRQSLQDEKAAAMHTEGFHEAAVRGHVATDKYVTRRHIGSTLLMFHA